MKEGDIVIIDHNEIELYEPDEFRSKEEWAITQELSLMKAEGKINIDKGAQVMIKFKQTDIKKSINRTFEINNIEDIESLYPEYLNEGLELYKSEIKTIQRPPRFNII